MQEPLVSIIIPTFNRAHLIGETLDSIIAQTYPNWECIVVDDGSTDATNTLLESYCNKDIRFKYHQRPKDRIKGANTCRNFGFEQSEGELINWFDSDDIMDKYFLINAVSQFRKQHSLDFVLFDFATFVNNIENVVFVQKNKTSNLIEDYATWKINCGTSTIVWKRKLVEKYRFNENLFRAQDLDFNLRIFFNEEYVFHSINKIGLYVRIHDNNLTSEFNRMNLKSLKSELTVRKFLIKKLIALKANKEVIKNSIKILNISFVKLYR